MKPSPKIRGGRLRRGEFSGCREGREGARSGGGRRRMRKTLLIPMAIVAALAVALRPRRAH